jgi:hypothetical protein
MKTIEELKTFYQTDLRGRLESLEKKRRNILQKVISAGICIFLAVMIFAFFFLRSFTMQPIHLFFALVFSLILFGIITYLMTRNYVNEFKNKIIRKIVNFIDPDLNYSPRGCISKTIFMASKIFKTKPNRYKGDDLVHGKVGQTKIRFSELHAEYESGSGKNRSRRTVFKGLFFIADFNKHFRGETIVLPDTAENLFGSFGKLLQSWNIARADLIKLEDPEFEKLFVVYGNNQIEARYILSTSLMARISDFKKKTGRKIYLSFIYSNVYVAVEYTKNLFEPRIFRTLLDFEPIAEYFDDLSLAVGIVDDLNLNTRIWTKQ